MYLTTTRGFKTRVDGVAGRCWLSLASGAKPELEDSASGIQGVAASGLQGGAGSGILKAKSSRGLERSKSKARSGTSRAAGAGKKTSKTSAVICI
jgi:hypothetical protein